MAQISRFEHIPIVISKLLEWQPNQILDLGAGWGLYGFLVRTFLDAWKERQSKEQWQMAIDAVDLDTSYYSWQDVLYDKVIETDATEMPLDGYDAIICIDLLQHCEKAKGEKILKRLQAFDGHVLLGVPLGNWLRKGKNQYETHRSTWKASDIGMKEISTYNHDGREVGLYGK